MESTDGLREAFGQVLAKYRQRAGISQERLALKIGVNRTYVYMVERGRQNPSLEAIFRFAKGIGVAPEDLVRETRVVLDHEPNEME